MNKSRQGIASANWLKLKENPYPGRGIVIGLSPDGARLYQIYWIMGRSENSRNRIFTQKEGAVSTDAVDPSKVTDPDLIFYKALEESPADDVYVVSNGKQTDEVVKALSFADPLSEGLTDFEYEPDAPNYTPRITGVCTIDDGSYKVELAILRRNRHTGSCERALYEYAKLPPGFGYCITTYAGDALPGEPLPSFQGDPLLLAIDSDLSCSEIRTVALYYWNTLNEANRVSLAVKEIMLHEEASLKRSSIFIINKYGKTGTSQ